VNLKSRVGKLPVGLILINNVSNTCEDCIVFILKEEANLLSKKELHNIIKERGMLKNIGKGRQTCVLKASTSGKQLNSN